MIWNEFMIFLQVANNMSENRLAWFMNKFQTQKLSVLSWTLKIKLFIHHSFSSSSSSNTSSTLKTWTFQPMVPMQSLFLCHDAGKASSSTFQQSFVHNDGLSDNRPANWSKQNVFVLLHLNTDELDFRKLWATDIVEIECNSEFNVPTFLTTNFMLPSILEWRVYWPCLCSSHHASQCIRNRKWQGKHSSLHQVLHEL